MILEFDYPSPQLHQITQPLPRFDFGKLSQPKEPRFGRSRPESASVSANATGGALNVHGFTRKFLSQFRGIAEVVKEFMEYIADSPLLGQNA